MDYETLIAAQKLNIRVFMSDTLSPDSLSPIVIEFAGAPRNLAPFAKHLQDNFNIAEFTTKRALQSADKSYIPSANPNFCFSAEQEEMNKILSDLEKVGATTVKVNHAVYANPQDRIDYIAQYMNRHPLARSKERD